MLTMFLRNRPPQTQRKPHIVQRWIETGDERCPLAGMWTTIASGTAETTEESDLPGRILRGLERGCAFPNIPMAA